MTRTLRRHVLALLLPALLAGCGDLPRPFAGNPGATARRLAQPPPSRLLIGPATAALLPPRAAPGFSAAIAGALQDRDVPAFAETSRNPEWRLAISAAAGADGVVPHFVVLNPRGRPAGAVDGPPVAASDWSTATRDTLLREAEAAAPLIAHLLDQVEATREESDPNSLLNRPARVAILGVTGAPGDGNTSLAHQVGLHLGAGGLVLQKAPAGADFTVKGEVRAVPEAQGLVRIELQWIVADAQGREAGRVVQINEVPGDAVSGLWGDAAIAAGQEAAAGLQRVIEQQVDGHKTAAAQPAGS